MNVTTRTTAVNNQCCNHHADNELIELTAIREAYKWSPEAAAGAIGWNPGSVRRAVRRGDLPALRIGSQIWLRPEDVYQWLGLGVAR